MRRYLTVIAISSKPATTVGGTRTASERYLSINLDSLRNASEWKRVGQIDRRQSDDQRRTAGPVSRGACRGCPDRLTASAQLQPMTREYRLMAAPFVKRGLADPTDHVLFRGCHGVLDRTTDGVDPQNAQPALHCDRRRDAADAVWRAVSGGGAQGQGPSAGLCRQPALRRD